MIKVTGELKKYFHVQMNTAETSGALRESR